MELQLVNDGLDFVPAVAAGDLTYPLLEAVLRVGCPRQLGPVAQSVAEELAGLERRGAAYDQFSTRRATLIIGRQDGIDGAFKQNEGESVARDSHASIALQQIPALVDFNYMKHLAAVADHVQPRAFHRGELFRQPLRRRLRAHAHGMWVRLVALAFDKLVG